MFTRTALVVACLTSSTLAYSVLPKPYYDLEDAEKLFQEFLNQYQKSYGPTEYLDRLKIFKENLEEINRRNDQQPKAVFKINRFADLTREEHKMKHHGFRLGKIKKVAIPDGLERAPDSLDWRKKDLVTHVKDQGDCGSCYIFSAVGNIEGQYAKKHKKCLAFSEGQCLDCLKSGSCDGGMPDKVMNELAQKDGLELEKDYGYIDNKRACKENSSKVVAHIVKGTVLDIPDEEVLRQNLADIGPLSVGLSADDFDYYGGGILHPDKCKGQPSDHGVVLVGYDTDKDGTKFWILKNSWGDDWGEDGYVRLLRGVNACQMGTSYTATAEVK